MQVLRAGLLKLAQDDQRGRGRSGTPGPGRWRRPVREDPHVQLQGEPGHRSPDRAHDLPHARRAGRRSRRGRRRPGRRRAHPPARVRGVTASTVRWRAVHREAAGAWVRARGGLARGPLAVRGRGGLRCRRVVEVARRAGPAPARSPSRRDGRRAASPASRCSTCSDAGAFRNSRPVRRPAGADPAARDRSRRRGARSTWRRSMARPITIVDLGTGSGAIALSLAAELPVAGVEVWATDVDRDALDVARANLAGIGRAGATSASPTASGSTHCRPELRRRRGARRREPAVRGHDRAATCRRSAEWEPAGALFGGATGLEELGRHRDRCGALAPAARRARGRDRRGPGRRRPGAGAARRSRRRDDPPRSDRARPGVGGPVSRRERAPGVGRSSWSSSRFSATTSCGVMWVTPDSGSTWCGRPAASSADENWSVCATTTLSSAMPWISSNGRDNRCASRQERAPRVVCRRRRRVAEVPLGVVRVVQTPVGHRRAGDGGMEHVGAAQHGEGGEVAAEAPDRGWRLCSRSRTGW